MPEKIVDSGGKRYKLYESGGKYTVYKDGSEIGSARSEEDALSVIKSDSGGGDAHIGGASCFPSTARVLTPNGERSIICFSPGDLVLSLDPVQQRLVERVVTKRLEHLPTRIWHIEFSSSRPVLRTTRNHSVLTTRGWLRVDRLKSNDYVVEASGRHTPIAKVFPTSAMENVYNLYTAGEHNFIVDGIVAHNFTWLREIRTMWHRRFLDNLRIPMSSVAPALRMSHS
jgi:hypothetical protein